MPRKSPEEACNEITEFLRPKYAEPVSFDPAAGTSRHLHFIIVVCDEQQRKQHVLTNVASEDPELRIAMCRDMIRQLEGREVVTPAGLVVPQ